MLPLLSPKTENLDLAMLSFLRSEILWDQSMGCTCKCVYILANVCTFFDHHMQVATEMQLR